jgi:hypothetical protein
MGNLYGGIKKAAEKHRMFMTAALQLNLNRCLQYAASQQDYCAQGKQVINHKFNWVVSH